VSVTYKVILTDHSIALLLLFAIVFPLKFDGYANKTNSFALTAPEFLKKLETRVFLTCFPSNSSLLLHLYTTRTDLALYFFISRVISTAHASHLI
jgi:hypothetical protein